MAVEPDGCGGGLGAVVFRQFHGVDAKSGVAGWL